MNAEPSQPRWTLVRRNSFSSKRKDREHRLPVRVVEEPAEPEQSDHDPGIGSCAATGCGSAGDPRRSALRDHAAPVKLPGPRSGFRRPAEPRLVEMGMLDRDPWPVDCGYRSRGSSRPGLDHRRIVKRPLPPAAPLEVPRPFPARPFVVGKRDGQRMPAPGRVVVDQGPVAVRQADRPRCPPRGSESTESTTGDHVMPSSRDELRRILWCGPLSRMNATISRRSCAPGSAGCCRSRSSTCSPSRSAPVVADRHDRRRERVGVERQDPPARTGGHDRVNPRHPAQPLKERSRERVSPSERSSRYFDFSVRGERRRRPSIDRRSNSAKSGVTCKTPFSDHLSGPAASSRIAAANFRSAPFPAVVENRRPEQPDRVIRRREERRIAVGIARRVSHQEPGAPSFSSREARLPRSRRRPTSARRCPHTRPPAGFRPWSGRRTTRDCAWDWPGRWAGNEERETCPCAGADGKEDRSAGVSRNPCYAVESSRSCSAHPLLIIAAIVAG